MAVTTLLVRTMSDTVETDIQRVFVIANEILQRYRLPPLTFDQLRHIADGPFDLFLIPHIFAAEFAADPHLGFNEAKRAEIRRVALEIARQHGYDANPPDVISGIEDSLRETKEAGLRNVLMTTGGRRYKHQAMEKVGLGGYFEDIVDREQTYYAKEQGLYYLYRKYKAPRLRLVVLTGTASYVKAANNVHGCKVGDDSVEVIAIGLSSAHSYNDEATLQAAQPKALIHCYGDLLPALQKLAPLE